METDKTRHLLERAALGQASMRLLKRMEQEHHPRYEEYSALAKDESRYNPSTGFSEADKNLLLKAYKEVPLMALEVFVEIPEVIEILGIDLENEDDIPTID